MAEGLAAISALSSILQLISFTAEAAAHTHELLSSGQDALTSNARTQKLTEEYRCMGTIRHISSPSGHSIEDEAILRIGKLCEDQSTKLIEQFEQLKLNADKKGVKRYADGAGKVAKTLWKRCPQATQDAITTAATAVGDDVEKILTFRDEQKFLEKRTKKLINSLWYPEIASREEAIHEAFPKTCEWAIKDQSYGLRPWLLDGEGIFWVTGKAGAGKSTVMKYVAAHQRTHELLNQWYDGHDHLFASFYFWYAGTPLQKSIPGLLRTLLYTVLDRRPELAQVAFPQHFASNHGLDHMSWTHKNLACALQALSDYRPDGGLRFKICFFIDGLDEYDGDHPELIALLRDWTRNPDVKLCVASRPWTAFRTAFDAGVPSLRVDDLSKADIRRYTERCLQGPLTGPAYLYSEEHTGTEVQLLVDDVVTKSEGVFLWVFLVVRSILRGVAEQDTVALLRHRVLQFPSDLYEFFHNILCRADGTYRAHTNQALKLACLKMSKSFVDYWWIRQLPDGFADLPKVYRLMKQPMKTVDWHRMFKETNILLNAACKDLLCLPQCNTIEAIMHSKVEFIHRTVYNFLQTDKLQESLERHTPPVFKQRHLERVLELGQFKVQVRNRTSFKNLEESFLRADSVQIDEAYVDAVEQVLWDRDREVKATSLPVELSVIVKLMAFGKSAHPLAIFRRSQWQFQGRTRSELLLAAFGEHHLNSFKLKNVNLELVRTLFAADRHQVSGEKQSNERIWQIFLRKWADEVANGQRFENDARHQWKLAELLMTHGAALESSFQDQLSHQRTAIEFISAQVPRKWLEESEQYRKYMQLKDRRLRLEQRGSGSNTDPVVLDD